jgi:hypothetical protein
MLAKTITFRRYSIAYMSILKPAKQKSHVQQKEDHRMCSTFLQFKGPWFNLSVILQNAHQPCLIYFIFETRVFEWHSAHSVAM